MAAFDPRVNQPAAPSCHLPQTEKCCWPELACETAVPRKWPPALVMLWAAPCPRMNPTPGAASGSCPVNVTQLRGPRATGTLTGGCAGPHAPTFGQRLQRGGASPLGAAQRPEVGPWALGKLPSGHSRRGVMGTGGQCGRPWLWPSLLWGCGGHFAPPGPQSAPPSCSSVLLQLVMWLPGARPDPSPCPWVGGHLAEGHRGHGGGQRKQEPQAGGRPRGGGRGKGATGPQGGGAMQVAEGARERVLPQTSGGPQPSR